MVGLFVASCFSFNIRKMVRKSYTCVFELRVNQPRVDLHVVGMSLSCSCFRSTFVQWYVNDIRTFSNFREGEGTQYYE
jgi:hypothetical protein